MKAEKEVIRLVEEPKRCKVKSAEAERLTEKLLSKISNDFSGGNIGDISIVDEPKGKQVENGVWETLGLNFDHNNLVYVRYYQIENSEKYIAVKCSYKNQGGTR